MWKKIISLLWIISFISGVAMGESVEAMRASKLKVFFGHKSVGYNIIKGITDLTTSFNISEGLSMPDTDSFFLHSQVGQNNKPQTKIDDFSEIINQIGDDCDVVFLKFCYIDVVADTDIDTLFANYKNTIEVLQNKYPELEIIHFTVPLTTVQKGPKALIKRLLGRSVGHEENIQRQKYNDYVRNEYSNAGLIFDLAKIESTRPDGNRVEHEKNGFKYYSLYGDYTDDGGHLNETGRKIVAEKLIELLAKID